MTKAVFETWIGADENERDVEVHVVTFYHGARATYYQPAEDPYIELEVYEADSSVDIWSQLNAGEQERLTEMAFEVMADD